MSNADPFVIAGRELSSRLILGTGGLPVTSCCGRVPRGVRGRAVHCRAPASGWDRVASRGVDLDVLDRGRGRGPAEHRRLLHRPRRGNDFAHLAREAF